MTSVDYHHGLSTTRKLLDDPALVEQLAAHTHEQGRALVEHCRLAIHWIDYVDLSEIDKDWYRNEARRVLGIVRQHLGAE